MLAQRRIAADAAGLTNISWVQARAEDLPDAAPGADRPSSNDVTVDDRGLIYLVDRVAGVDVIEANMLA